MTRTKQKLFVNRRIEYCQHNIAKAMIDNGVAEGNPLYNPLMDALFDLDLIAEEVFIRSVIGNNRDN